MTMFEEFVYDVICTGRLIVLCHFNNGFGWLMSLFVVCDMSEGNV